MPYYIDTESIVFAVALLGIVGMIVVKYGEIKTGRRFILSRIGERTDHIVHGAYDNVHYFISHINKQNAIASVQWVAYHILSWARNAYIVVRAKARRHPHSKRVIDMVAGRGEIKKGGSSFYLKRISNEPLEEETVATDMLAAKASTGVIPEIVAESDKK